RAYLIALMLVFGFSSFAVAKKIKSKKALRGTPIMWREPRDINSRDLYAGPGGSSMRPDLREVTLNRGENNGHSQKYRVCDAPGNVWVIKLGSESQPETAATRLLWAAGYFTDVDYLVPSVYVAGLNKTLNNARFSARPKGEVRLDEPWKWKTNPFVGRREFQ